MKYRKNHEIQINLQEIKMTDITTISALLTSIKTATDIAKIIKDTNHSYEMVDLKLQIVQLMDALLESKTVAMEIKEEIQEKEIEIKRLKEALQKREEVVKHGDAYFKKSDSGKPIGDPFCLYCWEVEGQLVHLSNHIGGTYCTKCGKLYPKIKPIA